MICPSCKAENADDALFCSKCGKKFKLSPVKNEGKAKSKLPICIVLAIAAVAVVFLAVVLKKDPVEKFVGFYESNEYVKANNIYGNKILGNFDYENKVFDYLNNSLNDSWNAYLAGSITAEELDRAIEKLHTVDKTEKIIEEITKVEKQYQVIKDSEIAYSEGKSKQESGELLEAIDEYSKVSADDPFNYEEAQSAISRIKEEYAGGLISKSKDSIANKQYAEALGMLEEAGRFSDKQDEVDGLKREASTLQFEEELTDCIAKDLFSKATSCYENAKANAYCVISDDMTKIYEGYTEGVRTSYLTSARETYKESGYLAAVEIINEGLQKFPNDETMNAYQELLVSAEPVLLKSLTIMDEHCSYEDIKAQTDKYDNTYTDCIGLSTMNVFDTPNRAFAKFLLDKKYTTLTFKMFNATQNSESQVCARVIADDLKIYESGYFTNQDKTKDVSLNVSNIEALEINANHLKGTGSGYAIFADAYVSKELTDEDFENIE